MNWTEESSVVKRPHHRQRQRVVLSVWVPTAILAMVWHHRINTTRDLVVVLVIFRTDKRKINLVVAIMTTDTQPLSVTTGTVCLMANLRIDLHGLETHMVFRHARLHPLTWAGVGRARAGQLK